ncbi:MAG: hypothetical protein ACI9OJ_004635 [Myxococcota bacterium]|jgi:hypothetical protein
MTTDFGRAILFIVLVAGCAGPSNLIEQATGELASADTAARAGNFDDALRLQRAAIETAARISVEFPESNEAGLVQRRSLELDGMSLKQLENRVVPASEIRVRGAADLNAASVFLGIASPTKRDDALVVISERLAKARPADADVAARWLSTPDARIGALLAAAKGYLAARNVDKHDATVARAAAAAREVDPVIERWPLLEKVTDAYLNSLRFDSAVAVARSIPEPAIRARALGASGNGLAADGRGREATIVLTEALEAANAIDAAHPQCVAWVRLARPYVLGGATDGARSLLVRIAKRSKEMSSAESDPILAVVAGLYALLGDYDSALTTVDSIDLPDERAAAFVAIAADAASGEGLLKVLHHAQGRNGEDMWAAQGRVLSAFGQFVPAEVVVREAAAISDPATRARTLLAVAAKKPNGLLYAGALAATLTIYEDTERAEVMAKLALAFAGGGHVDAGNQVLEEAIDAANKASTPTARVSQLLSISRAIVAAKQPAAAESLIAAGLQQAATITDALTSASKTTDLAILAVEAKSSHAPKAVGAAAKQSIKLEFQGSRASALIRVADLLARLGSRGEGAARDVLAATKSLDDAGRRDMVRRRVAPALAAAGKVDEAVALVMGDDRALSLVCAAAATHSHVEAALGVVRSITEPALRAMALSEIAAANSAPLSPTSLAHIKALLVDASAQTIR